MAETVKCRCGRPVIPCPGGPHGDIPCGGYVHADNLWHTCFPARRDLAVAAPSTP